MRYNESQLFGNITVTIYPFCFDFHSKPFELKNIANRIAQNNISGLLDLKTLSLTELVLKH